MTTPLRVLQVVTYMGRGGLETMLMNYYRRMDRSLVQFDFLVHRDFRADYDDEIESLGGRIFRIPRLVPWRGSYKKALDTFFKTHPEYRIVHVHQDCLSSVILKAAKQNGVPVRIAHSHNSSQDKNLKYLIKLYYKRQIPRNATKLFACGEKAGDWMFGGAPYQVLSNAVEAKQYTFDAAKRAQMRSQLAIAADALVVGHVGRFHTVKNHAFLLSIFAQLKRQRENAVLLLVGDGDLRKDVERQAKAMGILDSVIFTGVRSDVPDLMQAMDIFVMPSLYEGLPVTLMEAQASGLPCLVSDGVPAECDITDLVKHLALDAGAAVWAQHIPDHTGKTRSDTHAQIRAAGYDMETNAKKLQDYYLAQWKKEG